jgi:hypothetical protein
MWTAIASPVPEGWATTYAGKTYGDGGAFAGRAADGDRSPVFFDYLFHGGESKTDPRPFGGEKRLEDFVDNFSWNRNAVILDEDLDIETTTGAMMRHLYMEMPTGGHRLAGIFENA